MEDDSCPREFQVAFDQAAKHFPVIVLTGARQVGKSTFMRMQKRTYGYVSLDLPSLAALAEEEPSLFFEQHPLPLVIDEAQYAPGLFRYLKYLVDNGSIGKGQLVLTGSQKFTLMRDVGDSLAGRCAWLEMEGFSLHEMGLCGAHISTRDDFRHILVRGQMPALWKEQNLPSGMFWSSYVATYLERDVRQILNVQSLRDFERFMRLLAVRNGQVLNRADLARDTGISVKAAADWMSVLERSNVIHLLEPYYSNIGKRIVKSPKVHFLDTGLVCFLLGISEQSLAASSFVGSLWETLVLAEVRKRNRLLSTPANLYYYREDGGLEVDLLMEHGTSLAFVEMKWGENPNSEDIAPILKLDAQFHAKAPHITTTQHACVIPTGISRTLLKQVKVLPIERLGKYLAS